MIYHGYLSRLLRITMILSILSASFWISSCLPLKKAGSNRTVEKAAGKAQKESRLEGMKLIDKPDMVRLVITGNAPFAYTAFQVENPPRMIIDLNNTALDPSLNVPVSKNNFIKKITPSEARGDIVVTRIEVLMDNRHKNEISISKNNLFLDIFKEDKEGKSYKVVELIKELEEKPQAAETSKNALTPAPEKLSRTVHDQNHANTISGRKIKINTVKDKILLYTELENATIISGITIDDNGETITVKANGRLEPRVFNLGENRIVVDIPGVVSKLGKKTIKVGKQYLNKIRIGQHADSVRIVLDIPRMVPYELLKGQNEILISLNDTGSRQLTLPAAKIKNNTAKNGPATPDNNTGTGSDGNTKSTTTSNEPVVGQRTTTATLKKVNVEIKDKNQPQKGFAGKFLSINLQDADVRAVLRLLADANNQNIVISDSVTGSITMQLDNVPGDQILQVILEMNHLGMKVKEGIISIDTLANINKEQDEIARVVATRLRAEELVTKVIFVNYTNASDISIIATKSLSSRGKISSDNRTNALIVKDIKKNIDIISSLVDHLDNKTPQVLIEARIVQVVPEFNKALGIQWGASFSDISGNNITSISTGNTAGFSATSSDFGINMPASPVITPVPSIGFTFGRFTQNPLNLDLRLSAGEFEGLTKIVSTPKITVLDNQEAKIEQGESIPFATTSQNGTKTTFVDANLSLNVTPHVTSDDNIILKVKISKNAPGTTRPGAAGPSIEKREAITTIILDNHETAVIGGIFESTKVNNRSRVPLLSSIPFLGAMFRNSETREKTTELLVFLTPTILK